MALAWFLLLVLITAGAAVANRIPIPESVVWCVLGIAAGFVPGFPQVGFDPQIALFVFVPPLVYASAVELPWPEFRSNLRPIALLALGLVAVTTAVTAAIAHSLLQLSWSMAVVLGAVTAPTDPVAASAIASRVGIPHRLVAILEGEGLVNDAIALTVLRIALAAAAGAAFSIWSGAGRFLLTVCGEPAYGLLLAAGIVKLRSHVQDTRIEIAISLLTPFAAYLPPEHLGGSGILATVAAGMYVGERRSTLVPAGTRLHAISFWQSLVFLLNGSLFLLAGNQLRRLLMDPSEGHRLLLSGLLIGSTIIIVRFAWCVAVWFAFRVLRRPRRDREALPGKHLVIVGWAGMRGPISLAAALFIPAVAANARENQPIFLVTAVVIVMTLILQGSALTPMVRRLGVAQDAEREAEAVAEEEKLGRAEAARAALERLASLQDSGAVTAEAAERLRRLYEDQTLAIRSGSAEAAEVVHKLISAERARLLQLRNEHRVGDYALARLESELDLRESLTN